MSQPSAGPGSSGVYASPGNYRTNMTAFGVRPGVLQATTELPVGRLTFVADDGEVFLDAPINELHSVGITEMDRTLEVWQGDTRHRISLAPEGVYLGNLVGGFVPATLAGQWRDYLLPLVGTPPPGVRVMKPLSRSANIWLGVVVALAVLVLLAVAMVILS